MAASLAIRIGKVGAEQNSSQGTAPQHLSKVSRKPPETATTSSWESTSQDKFTDDTALRWRDRVSPHIPGSVPGVARQVHSTAVAQGEV